MPSRVLLTVIIATILLAGAAVAAYVVDAYGIKSRLEAMASLRGTRVVEGPLETRAVYEYGWFGDRTKVDLPVEGAVLDYARNGDHEVVLVADAATRVISVVLMTENGPRVLTSDTAIKATVDISSDGSLVAFAEMVAPGAGEQPTSHRAFYAPERWIVRQVDTASGTVTEAGSGIGPRFFTHGGEQYVAVTTAEGIRVRPAATVSDGMVLPLQTDGSRPAIVAPDGSRIALFDVPSASYVLYDLLITDRVAVTEAGRFVAKIARVGFDGTHAHMIGIEPRGGGDPSASLFVARLGTGSEPVKLHTDPALASVFDVLP